MYENERLIKTHKKRKIPAEPGTFVMMMKCVKNWHTHLLGV